MNEFNKEETLKKKAEIEHKERTKEFKECLGSGSTIYQCEEENDFIGMTNKEKLK